MTPTPHSYLASSRTAECLLSRSAAVSVSLFALSTLAVSSPWLNAEAKLPRTPSQGPHHDLVDAVVNFARSLVLGMQSETEGRRLLLQTQNSGGSTRTQCTATSSNLHLERDHVVMQGERVIVWEQTFASAAAHHCCPPPLSCCPRFCPCLRY